MVGALVKALFWLWPFWAWFLIRGLLGSLTLGGEYYSTALALGPFLLYCLGLILLGRNPGHRPSALPLLAVGSIVAGVLGFVAEYERWHLYLGLPGYTWNFILQHLDYPLSLVSLLAILVPLITMVGRNLSPHHGTAYGSARWLSMAEARKKFDAGGLVVGEAYVPSENPILGGRAPLLFFDGRGHLLTVSGSGGGKTTSVAVPNCLTWPGPLVAHDPKGELAGMCARARQALPANRQVAVLDPSDPCTAGFNVLGWLDASRDQVIENARAVASWLGSGEEPQGDNAYFYKEAAKLLQTLILHVVASPGLPSDMHTLREVRKLVASPELHLFLEQIYNAGDSFCFGAPSKTAGELLRVIKPAPKQWAGIVGFASEMTAWLDTPSLARLVCAPDSDSGFSLQDFMAGRVDVFVCVPLKTLDSTPQVARLIIGALLNAKYEQGVNNSGERTLFLIDEMPRLRKMDILETARDAGRGFGVTLWAIIQDLGQLEKYYEETGRRSWLENCQVKTFFGISDVKTASLLAEMLGKSTIEIATTGQSTGTSRGFMEIFGHHNTSTNTNVTLTGRDLMTADEIMRMAVDNAGVPDEQLVFLRGTAPLKCGLSKWYRRPEWVSFVDG